MEAVLAAIAMTPFAPVLIPELAGAAAAEVAGFRDAAVAAAATLPQFWIALGVGTTDAVIGPESRGTYAGYGVDVPVALSPEADSVAAGPPVAALPLCALFAGWLRGQANPSAAVQVRVYAAAHDAVAALGFGRALREQIDASDVPTGVLVVADGATTLTPPAPGGYEPDSGPLQSALDDALATGDADVLAGLSDRISGRVAYQVLAGLAEPGPSAAREFARGAPYGVGYYVGTWTP